MKLRTKLCRPIALNHPDTINEEENSVTFRQTYVCPLCLAEMGFKATQWNTQAEAMDHIKKEHSEYAS